MKGDDYIRGRHFRIHFWCGLAIGGIIGAQISWGRFEGPWGFFGCTLGIALAFALAVAYWGDPLWHWFVDNW